jgi:molecular chaperone IbpA
MDTVAALAPMRRSSIGFDHFFSVLHHAVEARDRAQYPPYNIERTNEDAYRLSLAVAGWTPAEISVTAQPRLLVVSGQKSAVDGKRYLYRGIPSGSFEHRFDLADDLRVCTAHMGNGLLTINLARIRSEVPAPRRIPIADPRSAEPRRKGGLSLVPPLAAGGSQREGTV